MDPHDRRALKSAARESLAAAPYDPRKLILLHTGVTIAVSLIGTILNFVLSKQIENTGGLGGMGLRSMLSTVQSVLQLLVAVALPFWEAGYCFVTMKIARNEKAEPVSMLQGFRRFWPLLRVRLSQFMAYFLLGLFSFILSYYSFMLTPLSDPLYEIINTINIDSALLQTEIMLDDATILAITDAYTPMLIIWLALFSIGAVIISYRFRMATFLVFDHPELRGRETLRISSYQLRGHTKELIKLDLSYLWYFALNIMAGMLAYGDYLLPLIGVQLPMSSEVAYFAFLLLSLALQAGLFIWAKNQVDVTYAKFYCLTALPFYQSQEEDSNNAQSDE